MRVSAFFLGALLLLLAPSWSRADNLWHVAARAECVGPDGAAYTTEVVSLSDGTVRFIQADSSDTTQIFVRDGLAFQPAEDAADFVSGAPELVEFASGHDVHRMVLSLPPESERPSHFDVEISAENGGGVVRIELADWREVVGLELPFQAVFVHNGQRFRFEYTEVLPFRLAPHTELPKDPALAFARLGDLQNICAVHERALAAHRNSDVEMLLGDTAEQSVISGRGRLSSSSVAASRNRLGPYLAQSAFESYQDVVVPVVDIADDGSLAWLACEIEASGTQVNDSGATTALDFGYSWVELLAKRDGHWLRVGNASSERPE